MKNTATLEQVAYYICMEEMVDGSFDDLMAVVQLGMPIHCKMVAGENYWDEMGNGNFTVCECYRYFILHLSEFSSKNNQHRENQI